MPKHHALTFFIALLLVAGCAGSREAAQAPHPLVGNWEYTLDTPQGVYTGLLTFTESEEGLAGMIHLDETPIEEAAPMEELAFDSETMQLTYSFDGGEFGRMSVTMTLEGDNMDGLMTVHQFGVDVPLVAARQVDDE